MVQRILELVRLRGEHPAFEGQLEVTVNERRLRLTWAQPEARAELEVDVASGELSITT